MPRNLNVQPKQFEPVQLKLFMSAGEWKDSMTDSVDLPFYNAPGSNMSTMWESKLEEAKQPRSASVHGAGVYDSIKQVGYYHDHPDSNAHPTIGLNDRGMQVQDEGHHRIAAAAEIERETGKSIWIPTRYRED